MTGIKLVDTSTLKALVGKARDRGYEKLMECNLELQLEDKGKHVLYEPMYLGNCVRCSAMVKVRGFKGAAAGELDIAAEDWNSLKDYQPKPPPPKRRIFLPGE